MRTHDFILAGGDTDGLAFRKPDHSPFSEEEQKELVEELNSYMEPMIRWEIDGVFPVQLVIAAKNYVLVDTEGERTTKGASLKATTKEAALKEFVEEVIHCLLNGNESQIEPLYMKYAKEILSLKDISRWCSKHTVTRAVLEGKGTAQVRLRQAIETKPVQEGDKFYCFFKTESERCLLENFDGTYDSSVLLNKLYDTLCIFEPVFDVKSIPKLTLVRNKNILKGLTDANSQLSLQV